MSSIDILFHVIHPDTSPPPIWPCDTPNGSDTKPHWTAEELRRSMGCRQFKNYCHLLQLRKDSVWVDSGEFPTVLGSYTTIPKAKWWIHRSHRVLLSWPCPCGYCLWWWCSYGRLLLRPNFVYRATIYNWVFGLKSLQSTNIVVAFSSFCAETSSLAYSFCYNCDEKSFGSAIKQYLLPWESDIHHRTYSRRGAYGSIHIMYVITGWPSMYPFNVVMYTYI